MKILVRSRLRVEKDVIVRIARSLRGRGNFSVKVGQEVHPDEIIGSSEVSIGFRTMNLAALLSISPQDIKKYLKKTLGQRIYKGELLAFKPNFLFMDKKYVTAPTDGILDYINEKNGEIRLTLLPRRVNLPAGVYGVVEKIDENNNQAIIRTQVTKIYGIFGTGRVREGFLYKITSRDGILTHTAVSPKFEDNILIGGSLVTKEAVTSSISAGVNGIVVGGISADDYKSMVGRIIFPKKMENDIGIAVVITEGFGSIPMGEGIFDALSQHEGKFAVVDGNRATISLPSFSSSCMIKIRRTSLAEEPISTSYLGVEESEPKGVELRIGSGVRVIGSSFTGEMGKVVFIDQNEALMPSGIRAYMVTVETKRRKIQVPSTNLEAI
ncbi:MAG: hypothetical protein Q8P92_03000 [Candidatus Daviesbacteria bacterium]|nr:hypothetical protein [Candidatus Daviesbacteria bacterium]